MQVRITKASSSNWFRHCMGDVLDVTEKDSVQAYKKHYTPIDNEQNRQLIPEDLHSRLARGDLGVGGDSCRPVSFETNHEAKRLLDKEAWPT